MSEDISDKIENGQWVEGEKVGFECPDGKVRLFYCGGSGYGQRCGGWEHEETGQLFAIANWGDRKWNKDTVEYLQLSSAMKPETTDGDILKVYTTTESGLCNHPYGEQMLWWFKQKDIDVSKLKPISFTWEHNVGVSYTLENGPQKDKAVKEPIPACIPRGMFYGVTNKKYLENDWDLKEDAQSAKILKARYVLDWSKLNFEMTYAPSGGN